MNKYYQLNERIRAPSVRLIADDGENLGVVKKEDAIQKAREKDLDLVLIAEKANPPVAKILDFKKFLYEEKKKASEAKAGSKKSELKELRLSPSIGEGDLENRIERAKEFLENNNQVRITLRMRGREALHPEIAMEKVETVIKALDEIARTESDPKRQGNQITVTFVKK